MGERSARGSRDARRRALGQNFLASPALASQLVRQAGVGRDDLVVEVGAGSGVLTAALARRAGGVVAIELDPVWAARLRQRFDGQRRVEVIEGDALHAALPDGPFRVVANLPFGRSTALLQRLLDDPRSGLRRADVLLQWEVARKRAQSARTLIGAGWAPWWSFRLGLRVPREAFRPVPAVDGGVLVVERRPRPLLPADAADAYRTFVRGLYAGTLAPQLATEQWAALFAAYDGARRAAG